MSALVSSFSMRQEVRSVSESGLLALKRQFAIGLLYDPDKAYDIAKRLFPENFSDAMIAADFWPTDPIVEQCKQELLEEKGEMYFLPTKGQILREVVTVTRNANAATEKFQGYGLYAKLMGWNNEGGGGTTNNFFGGDNKVMEIVRAPTDDAWKQIAIEQQTALVESARREFDNDEQEEKQKILDEQEWTVKVNRS